MKIVMILGMFFMFGIQPMVMISMLMMLVVSVGILVYYCMGDVWLFYLLMLIMMSGVLVLFTYMASLSPNEKFELVNIGYLVILMLGISLKWGGMENGESSMVSFFFWKGEWMGLTMFMIILLFGVMIMITELSGKVSGAVRVN